MNPNVTDRIERCPPPLFEPAPPTVSISSRCSHLDFQKLLLLRIFGVNMDILLL